MLVKVYHNGDDVFIAWKADGPIDDLSSPEGMTLKSPDDARTPQPPGGAKAALAAAADPGQLQRAGEDRRPAIHDTGAERRWVDGSTGARGTKEPTG